MAVPSGGQYGVEEGLISSFPVRLSGGDYEIATSNLGDRAGVVVGAEAVAKAPKDGHTLLYNTIAHSVLRPLFPRLPFDPVADFAPVALVGVIPMVLMVGKDVPANSLQELIRLYRDNPGKYDYGSAGNGSALQLAAELFAEPRPFQPARAFTALGVFLAALLFGFLYQGGGELALWTSIPREMIVVIQALVILFTGALDNMVRMPLERLFARRAG